MHTHSFLGEKAFYEIHLLSFAKNLLMLPTKLSNTRVYFARHFAYLSNHTNTFIRHFDTHLNIHTLERYLCYLSKHTYIFARNLCYLSKHTYMFSRHFATYQLHFEWHFLLYVHIYLHLFEKQFNVTHSHIQIFIGKEIFMLHIHWKGNFMSYVPILRSIFVPYLTYMHICKALGYLFNLCTLYLKGIYFLLPILYTHVHGEEHFHTI